MFTKSKSGVFAAASVCAVFAATSSFADPCKDSKNKAKEALDKMLIAQLQVDTAIFQQAVIADWRKTYNDKHLLKKSVDDAKYSEEENSRIAGLAEVDYDEALYDIGANCGDDG